MFNTSNLKSSTSLNDAFDLILKIFNEERTYYENTINSLKDKVSILEETLIKVKKENISYQSRISKLKDKLNSISKTVSKLEESEFEIKLENAKDIEQNDINKIMNSSHYNTIKYRNTDTLNSFRKNTKNISEINKSNSITNNSNNYNSHYLKMNLLENTKLSNNGEDINTNYNKKTHKKTLSTKIKNSILNLNNPYSSSKIKRRNEGKNNIFKSHCYNDEDVSFLLNNLNENEKQSKMTVDIENDKIINVNRKKYLGRDKFNKIEQKIKGLKSALSIYSKQDNLDSNESVPSSVNIVQNINCKSSPYII